MKRLVLIPVVALLLAWQASQVAAQCAEGESLYFSWQTVVIAMDVANINHDIALANLNTALDALWQKQQEAIQHLQGHANCGVQYTCYTALQLQAAISDLSNLVDEKYADEQSTQYTLNSAIATEQQAWWDMVAHIEWCPEC